MSDLKYKDVKELIECKAECETYIQKLKTTLAGQQTRLEWIDKYIYEKTPKELTIKQVENILGHRLIIKS